jgi:hypothetical protein
MKSAVFWDVWSCVDLVFGRTSQKTVFLKISEDYMKWF